jgi:hypothetical protein
MKNELKELLKERYPSVYGQCQRWSFHDGWYGILSALGERLSHQERVTDKPIQILGMKEKYGLLDIDINTADSQAWAMAEFANQISGLLCEICGKPGQIVKAGELLQTRCGEHRQMSPHQANVERVSYAGTTDQIGW